MRDRAWATPDGYVGTPGPSWLYRWSRTLAQASSFTADPDVRAWVTAGADAATRR
jgi:hypothetical protein